MTDAEIWASVKSATSSTSLKLTDNTLNLDVNSNTYIHMNSSGIDMKG
jgi:hypothetical protein